MSNMGWARAFWLAVCAAYVAAVVWAAASLPEQVASHWDFSGRADGWMGRDGFLVFSVLLGLGVIVGMPLLTHQLTRGSGEFVNVPHKDYWLDEDHPQRRVEFRRRFFEDMCVLSGLTGLLLVWLQVETVYANNRSSPDLPWWTMMPVAVYVVIVLAYSFFIVTRRYQPPTDEPGQGNGQGPILPI